MDVYLSLGSNLGDRERSLEEAVNALDGTPGIRVTGRSSIYETSPWGVPDQPAFLNQVVRVRSEMDPHALLIRAREIERQAGRTTGERWGARVLDIDLLVAGDLRIRTPDLTLPHPRIGQRRFVLVPLAELAGDLEIPGTGGTVNELMAACRDRGSVRRLAP